MRKEPWYRFAVMLLMTMRPLFRADLDGFGRLPRRGGCIVVANHVSLFDPLPVAYFVHRAGRRPRFMIMAALFRWPLLGTALRGLRQIPVERGAADASTALDVAVAAVRRGECVVVYPEGGLTRDPDGWPMRGKTGVARLALATGAPVVPLAQWGTQQVPRFWRWIRITMRAGAPVAVPEGASLREVTDGVMAALTDLVAECRRGNERAEPRRRVARLLPETAAAGPDEDEAAQAG